jgi:hypothetical protein
MIRMKSMILASLLLLGMAGCAALDGTGLEEETSGSASGGTPGPYWSRNDGQRTAYVYLSGGTAKACSGGVETLGTFNSSKPSMTFIIGSDRIEFPLRFLTTSNQTTTSSDAMSLLVGVPDQAVNTNTATWYVKSSTYTCAGGGSTGGGSTGGGGGTGGSTLGRITFYTTRSDGVETSVTLGGQAIGSLTTYFGSGAPDCRQTSGVVSVERTAGTYSFAASDREGRTWSGSATATSGGCQLIGLR